MRPCGPSGLIRASSHPTPDPILLRVSLGSGDWRAGEPGAQRFACYIGNLKQIFS
jgi:hypothetical protein